jgi:hypothetical protein
MDLLLKNRVLKKGASAQLALAGPDRASQGQRLPCKVTDRKLYIRNTAYIAEITLALESPAPSEFKPTAVIRLHAAEGP